VLNTVFGGYFGSRLMTNIREEKGYTYGIYSALSSYQHGGVFEINTEVGKEVKDATLKEIAHEIEVVKNERVGDEELETVKNYMAGKILRSLDGPLKFADVLKGLVMYNRDTDYLQQYLHTIQSVTANELQDLAIKHFNFDKMYQVTVG
jgi:predicted Zn-dependent peptidase